MFQCCGPATEKLRLANVHSLEILLISILHLSSFFFSEPCHIYKMTQKHLVVSFILQIFKSFLGRSTNEYSTSSFSQN